MPPQAKTGTLPTPKSTDLPPPRFTLVDQLMIALAVLSALIVVADIFQRQRLIFAADGVLREPLFPSFTLLPTEPYWIIMYLDLLITTIFLVEFLGSAKEYGSLLGYARANWFDVLGMFPMAFFVAIDYYAFGCQSLPSLATCGGGAGLGFLRFLRFARIIRIFVAGSRLARAANMTFGEQVVARLFGKYKALVVAELTTPILLQAINITQGIITRGKYAESIGKELDAKRDEIYALIIKNLEARKSTATMIQPEFIREAIRRAEEEVLDTVVLTLTSEELNKIIADTIDRVLEDFKKELKKKDWAQVAFNREHMEGAAPAAPPAGAKP